MPTNFKILLFYLGILGYFAPQVRAGDDSVLRSQLDAISEEFAAGDFESCKIQLENLATQELQMKPTTRLQYYQLQARLSFAFENRQDMETWIRKFHALNPSAELDGSKDPPEALAFLEKLKKQEADARQHAEALHNSTEDKKSFALSVLPFGIGHVYQQRFLSGLFFMGSEVGYMLYLNRIDRKRTFSVGPASSGDEEDYDTEDDQSHQMVRRSSQFKPHGIYLLGAVSGFVGMWAFETISLKRSLLAIDFEKASALRRVVSLAPLGAAQWQNRSYFKGLFFLASELTLISISCQNYVKSSVKPQAFGLLVGLMALGAIDGYGNYKPVENATHRDSPIMVAPTILAQQSGSYGLGMNLTFGF